MHRYIIERDLPGAGKLTEEQLQHVRETSNTALSETGPGIQWVESFVTADRIYCHYLAENETLVVQHARLGGFPCTKVSEVRAGIDPLLATMQSR